MDFHTHILPSIDDGSSDVEESLEMLREEQRQGTELVVLSSHYYADAETPEQFLKRRHEAFTKLTTAMKDNGGENMPKLLLGAEVHFYPGMSEFEQLEGLRLEGTKLLLLEMPMKKWNDELVWDVLRLQMRYGFQVVLAHIERYLPYNKRTHIKQLLSAGVRLQINAEALDHWLLRRRVLPLLAENAVTFFGSDAHNLTIRAVNIENGYRKLEYYMGREWVEGFREKQMVNYESMRITDSAK